MRILYIAGYGRSGSTILSAILGSHEAGISLGEVSFLFEERATSGRTCSCGRTYGDCPIWGPAGQDLDPAQARRATRSAERVLSLARFLLRMPGPLTAYRSAWQRILSRVQCGSDSAVLIDSSKTAWATAARPMALARIADADVRVLHLVRDGRATMDSLLRTGSNWELEGLRTPRRAKALRAVVGWIVANLSAAASGRVLGSGRYLRIRYEDLLDDPTRTLREVGAFAGLEGDALVRIAESEAPLDVGHMVGGNRVRFDPNLRLRRPSGAPRRPDLSAGQSRLFGWLGGWLNRRYGYVE